MVKKHGLLLMVFVVLGTCLLFNVDQVDTTDDDMTYHIPSEGKQRTQYAGTAGFLGKYHRHNLLRAVWLSSDHQDSEELDHVEDHHPPAAAQDVIQEVNNEDPDLKQEDCNVTDHTRYTLM